MSCEACLRWRRRPPPKNWPPGLRYSGFGMCHWPGTKPAPYWREKHPTGDLMTHETHGEACLAFKPKARK